MILAFTTHAGMHALDAKCLVASGKFKICHLHKEGSDLLVQLKRPRGDIRIPARQVTRLVYSSPIKTTDQMALYWPAVFKEKNFSLEMLLDGHQEEYTLMSLEYATDNGKGAHLILRVKQKDTPAVMLFLEAMSGKRFEVIGNLGSN